MERLLQDLQLLDVPYSDLWKVHAQDRRCWKILVAAAKGPDGLQVEE